MQKFLTLLFFSVCASSFGQVREIDGVAQKATNLVKEVVREESLDQAKRLTGETGKGYTELATGLLFHNSALLPEPAEARFVIEPDGRAAARKGQHQVVIPPNILGGVVEILLPNNSEWIQSKLFGVGYFDQKNKQRVLIAELKSSIGELIGENQILFRDAFEGITADVLYTYSRGGFEQDIILRESPHPATDYGVESTDVRLEVLTEFVGATVKGDRDEKNNDADVVAATLDFGGGRIGRGVAFYFDGKSKPFQYHPKGHSHAVKKEWVAMEGRRFLIESIDQNEIASELKLLPVTRSVALAKTVGQQIAGTGKPTSKNAISKDRITLASAAHIPRGFLIDYVLTVGGLTNFTFRGGETYFLSDHATFYGVTRIEGGAVIKVTTNWGYGVFYGPVECATGPFNRAFVTSQDDDSVGEVISGSTGVPEVGNYSPFLLDGGGVVSYSLKHLHLSFLNRALEVFDSPFAEIENVQIQNSFGGVVSAGARLYLRNSLMVNVNRAFETFDYSTRSTNTLEHLSIHHAEIFIDPLIGTNGSLNYVTNVLLVAVTNLNAYGFSYPYYADAIVTNSVVWHTNDAAVFQSAGFGNHYLPTNSVLRNAGTTNVTREMAKILGRTTTEVPASGVAPTNSILLPRQIADNDTPDLGYHYPRVDYLVSNLQVTNTLVLSNGVVLASATAGESIHVSGALFIKGSRNASSSTVGAESFQESIVGINTNLSGRVLIALETNSAATVTLDFGMVSGLQGKLLSSIEPSGAIIRINDSVLAGGDINLSATNSASAFTLTMTNTVRASGNTRLRAENNGSDVRLGHNTFAGGSVTLTNLNGTETWGVQNNFFSLAATGSGLSSSFNAYSGSAPFGNSTGNDLTNVTVRFRSGAYGHFYQYPWSPLVDSGSTNSSVLGFALRTTMTEQTQERLSQVDIGVHYPAAFSLNSVGQFRSPSDVWSAAYTSLYGGLPDRPIVGYNYHWEAWQTYHDTYCFVTERTFHPGHTNDVVKTFKAPVAGWWSLQSLATDGHACGPNGVQLRVLRNNDTLIGWTHVAEGMTNVVVDWPSVWLEEGDLLHLQVNSMWYNNSCDTLLWNTVLVLESLHADSDRDGLSDELEDTNGNGVRNTGETDPNQRDTDYDGRSDFEELIDLTDPVDATAVLPIKLGHWRFDNSFTGEQGQEMFAGYAELTNSWSGRSLYTKDLYWVAYYPEYRSNNVPNINVRRGSVRMWIKPDWSSVSAGGSGSGHYSALLNMGKWTPDGSVGYWALGFTSGASDVLMLQTQTNGGYQGIVACAVSFQSNRWSQVVVTYDQSGSAIYIDGVLKGTGNPVNTWLSPEARSTGIMFGNDWGGWQPARAKIDEIETFNYRLSSSEILSNYQAASAIDSDGDSLLNGEEWLFGTDPEINNLPSGSPGALRIFTPLE